jgi:hypothetical protein
MPHTGCFAMPRDAAVRKAIEASAERWRGLSVPHEVIFRQLQFERRKMMQGLHRRGLTQAEIERMFGGSHGMAKAQLVRAERETIAPVNQWINGWQTDVATLARKIGAANRLEFSVTKQAAIRAINEAKTVAELRAALLAMVEKLAWPIEVKSR